MNVLVIDHVLMFGLSVAQRLAKDGHKVVYSPIWGIDSDSPYVDFLGKGSKGLILDPEGWMRWLKWADVITITGSEHRGKIVKFLRSLSIPVSGPDNIAANLELNRDFGYQVAKAAGIKTGWQQKFSSLTDVEEYVKSNPAKYVFKLDQTMRAAGETFVTESDTGEDLINYLQKLTSKVAFANGSVDYYLQEYLKGTEVAISGWFNGHDFIDNKLIASYDGVGGFVFDTRVDVSKLINVNKIRNALASMNYRGIVDLNGMLVGDEFYYLEFTPRWGTGITEFFCHAVEDMGELLLATATGDDTPLLKSGIDSRIALVVNARDEDSDGLALLDIAAKDALQVPAFRAGDTSFWCDSVCRCTDGKLVSLPIQRDERRKGRYVAVADSLESAVEKIEDLNRDIKICGTSLETARAVDELKDRVETIYQYSLK
jgi:hypothetical protein